MTAPPRRHCYTHIVSATRHKSDHGSDVQTGVSKSQPIETPGGGHTSIRDG